MRTYIVLFLTILFWGLAFTGIKIAVEELNPFELTFYRFLIADVFFAIYIVKRRAYLSKEDLRPMFLLGVVGITAYHVCLNYGEIYITSGLASLIISTAPVFIFVASILFLKERITLRKTVGSVLALFGVFVIIFGSEEVGFSELWGVFVVFISSISATFYTIYGKSLFRRYDPLILTSYSIIFATIPLVLFVRGIPYASGTTWLSVVFLGIFSTVVGYMGWYYVLDKMTASKASVYLQAIPVVSILAGSLLLGEEMNFYFFVGAIMVIAGVLLVTKNN
jgi:drug/metabolite transporter (DMT)-like permease